MGFGDLSEHVLTKKKLEFFFYYYYKLPFLEALLLQFASPVSSSPPFHPLLLHFSIMETLESFSWPPSFMSLQLFPFLTSPSRGSPPASPRLSTLSHRRHRITDSLSQAISLPRLLSQHGLLHLRFSSSPITLLSSLVCQQLLLSELSGVIGG